MGKRIIAAIIIIALVLVAAPPLMGIAYETQVREQIANAPDNPTIDFALVDYERGFYTSSGAFRVTLSEAYIEQMRSTLESSDPANPPTPEQQEWIDELLELISGELRFDLDAQHGPVNLAKGMHMGLATVHVEMDSTSGKLAEVQQILGVPYLLRGDAQVGFDGSFAFQAEIPPMAQTDPEYSFDFSGMNYDGHFDRVDRGVRATGGTERLSITFDSGQLSVQDIELTADTKMLSGYLWSGRTSVDVAELHIRETDSATGSSVDLLGLGFDADVALSDAADKLTIAIIYRLASMAGVPDTNLANLRVGIRLRNIERQAIEDYIRVAQNAGFGDPGAMPQALRELQSIGAKILRGSPGLDLSPFEFVLNGEPFTANLAIDFDGASIAADIDVMNLGNNPDILIAAISASGQLDGSESLARSIASDFLREQIAQGIPADAEITPDDVDAAANQQAGMMIDSLVLQGMVARDGDQLSVDLNYKNGQLLVNGMPLQFGQ